MILIPHLYNKKGSQGCEANHNLKGNEKYFGRYVNWDPIKESFLPGRQIVF